MLVTGVPSDMCAEEELLLLTLALDSNWGQWPGTTSTSSLRSAKNGRVSMTIEWILDMYRGGLIRQGYVLATTTPPKNTAAPMVDHATEQRWRDRLSLLRSNLESNCAAMIGV